MKLVKRCLLSLSIATAAFAAQAQSADEIIAKHIDAIGGKEKLSGITSVKMANSIQVMGNDAPASVVILNGKGFRSESEFNGQKMIQVYTEKGGWMVNPMMGSADPTEMPEAQVKAGQAQIYAVPFLDYAVKGNKAEYLGQEKVGNVNAYKIKLTDKNNTTASYFFDPSTYYLIQVVRSAEMMGQQMEVIMSFSDFKKTDYGWVVPQTSEMNMGGQFTFTSKLKSIEVNTPVDAAVFEMKK
jgi:hypothetical protein